MNLENISHCGWNNCLRITDGVVELVITLDVGPRIIRFGFIGGQNLFHTFEDQLGMTSGTQWRSYGGHRLWHAPEVVPRTYYPDNDPVEYTYDGDRLRLAPPPQESNGIALGMVIQLEGDGTVSVEHQITNIGLCTLELAPWCLSVMSPGGRAIIPQEEFRPHPDYLLPARPLVLWHFTDMSDPRWLWGRKYIQLQQDDRFSTKQKVGAGNSHGWAAYILHNDVFIKRFSHEPHAVYPDMGSNCELFTKPGFLEIESLGPLTHLAPNATVTHMERWGLYKARVDYDEASIDETILPLINRMHRV